MNAAFEDALVTGYEALIDQMGNDPKNRHVRTAAVIAEADSIIASQGRDLTTPSTSPSNATVGPS